MTETEFTYLMLCLGAFLAFALTLAYSTWSWGRFAATSDVRSGAASHSGVGAKSAA